MKTEDLRILYEYNYWATRRVLKQSEKVSAEQLLAGTSHSFGSLRGTLVHILDAERAWRMLLQHNTLSYFDSMKEQDYPTLKPLRELWNQEEREMREYLAQLTDTDLTTSVRYTLDSGEKRERVLWHCLVHVVNHGTHHRSQAASILKGHGYSPGELDFTVYLNEQKQ